MSLIRSVLELDSRHHATQKAVGDKHVLHQYVMSGFDHYLENGDDFFGEQARGYSARREDLGVLYAIDHRPDGSVWLMVQSTVKGDWTGTKIGRALLRDVSHRPFTPLTKGEIRYQIVVNPVRRNARTRKQYVLTNPVDVEEWWRQRATNIGLDVNSYPVKVIESGRDSFRKSDNHPVTISTSKIAGTARIMDADLFAKATASGVGKARAYGCGLLLALPGR